MDPTNPLRAAVDSVFSNLSSNWGGVAHNVRREVGRAAAFAIPAALRRQQQLFDGGLTPALAVSIEQCFGVVKGLVFLMDGLKRLD